MTRVDRNIVRQLYSLDEKIYCNAQYLIDMIEALPNAAVTYKSNIEPIYFKSDDGEGLLLPIRRK